MSSGTKVDGRVARRVEAMRRVQDAALELFEQRGFGAVTIEDIAAAAEVGPATVYRNFGTKERIVLWDEYDPLLLEAIRARLGGPWIDAVAEGVIAAIGDVYEDDKRRILRRSRLMLEERAIRAEALAERDLLQRALAELLGGTRRAEVAAAAYVATLEAAIVHWVADRGRTPLAKTMRAAFRDLRAAT